ncbi:unnamed protein product [Sympodiomycopsis kandeliae]
MTTLGRARHPRLTSSNWKNSSKFELYSTAREFTDNLFNRYRQQMTCPDCSTTNPFSYCSNGGGKTLQPVKRRYKHQCPIGSSHFRRSQRHFKGKTFTVGVSDMLMNFVMPILERESRGPRKKYAVLAGKQLLLCHQALNNIAKSGCKVDRQNLAIRFKELERIHGPARARQIQSNMPPDNTDVEADDTSEEDQDDLNDDSDNLLGEPEVNDLSAQHVEDNVFVEVPAVNRIGTPMRPTSTQFNIQSALQAGLLLGHPTWHSRPTGSVPPEESIARSLFQAANRDASVNIAPVSTNTNNDSTANQEDPSDRNDDEARDTMVNHEHAVDPREDEASNTMMDDGHSIDRDYNEASGVKELNDEISQGFPFALEQQHQRSLAKIRILYVDIQHFDCSARQQCLTEFSAMCQEQDSQPDNIDIMVLVNSSRGSAAATDVLGDPQFSSWVRAISPFNCGVDAHDNLSNSPGVIILCPPEHAHRVTVLSITPYTCTFRLLSSTSRLVHVVSLPPAMGALGNHQLFTNIFRPPGGLKPDIIFGKVDAVLPTSAHHSAPHENGSATPRRSSRHRQESANQSPVTRSGRAKIIQQCLADYGLVNLADTNGSDRNSNAAMAASEANRPNRIHAFTRQDGPDLFQDSFEDALTRLCTGRWRDIDGDAAILETFG